MKRLLSIIFLFFLSCTLFGQHLDNETITVLKTVFNKTKPGDLFPELGGLRYLWIKQNLSGNMYVRKGIGNSRPDSLKLSDEEKNILDNGLEKSKDFLWTKETIKKTGLNMNVVMTGIPRQGDPLSYAILKPILIRNNTFCFTFYSSFTKQTGYHNLSIWKKTNGKWSLWKVIAERKI